MNTWKPSASASGRDENLFSASKVATTHQQVGTSPQPRLFRREMTHILPYMPCNNAITMQYNSKSTGQNLRTVGCRRLRRRASKGAAHPFQLAHVWHHCLPLFSSVFIGMQREREREREKKVILQWLICLSNTGLVCNPSCIKHSHANP